MNNSINILSYEIKYEFFFSLKKNVLWSVICCPNNHLFYFESRNQQFILAIFLVGDTFLEEHSRLLEIMKTLYFYYQTKYSMRQKVIESRWWTREEIKLKKLFKATFPWICNVLSKFQLNVLHPILRLT